MRYKVLCIEDDLTIQTIVTESLKEFEVTCVGTLKEAEASLKTSVFDAITVDIQLPDGDGLRFLTELTRDEKFKNIPILILTEHAALSNKVMAFSFGADDFITKPFDPIEFNARIAAKIRRAKNYLEKENVLLLGNLTIDHDRQKVCLNEKGNLTDLGLTTIEIKILSLLTKRLEQVYSRSQLMDMVWDNTTISDRTIDSHIAHLRQKIEPTNLKIETVKGFGYRAVIKT